MFCLLSNFLVVIFYVDTDITRVLVSSILIKFKFKFNKVCSLQCFKEILRNIDKKICASISVISFHVRIITDAGYRYEASHQQTLSYLTCCLVTLPEYISSCNILA